MSDFRDGLLNDEQQGIASRRRFLSGTMLVVVGSVLLLACCASLVMNGTGVGSLQQIEGGVELAKKTKDAISDSGRFERLQHFKDVGVPATTSNPLARACISFATCMLFHVYPAGLFNPKHAELADGVLAGVSGLPSSNSPSYMVLTANQDMPDTCTKASTADANALEEFSAQDVAGSLDNWHRALCATAAEPSWGGHFDPAYQPQQQALTLGLTCSFVCDLAGKTITNKFLDTLTRGTPTKQVVTYCQALPWGEGWKGANSFDGLKPIATKLSGVCKCGE